MPFDYSKVLSIPPDNLGNAIHNAGEKAAREFERKYYMTGIQEVSGPLFDLQGKLSEAGEEVVARGFDVMKMAVLFNNIEKGWRKASSVPPEMRRNFGELSMLVTTEIAEAFEAYRDCEPELWYQHQETNGDALPVDASSMPMVNGALGKPQGAATELGDAIIRILDFADEYQLPLIEAMLAKHKYNQTRPYRHGGKKA